MIRPQRIQLLVPACAVLVFAAHGLAQEPATRAATQPATRATTAPAGASAVQATVLNVRGTAEHAPLGSSDWRPCRVDDAYPPETVIRTGIRSSVQLKIGDEAPYTALAIESASKVILSEAYRTTERKRVRVGLGYGRVRAGVAEGGLQSDFTIDSPVATLSKRGTWDFGMFYERGTDRFQVFVLDRGLVQVLDRLSLQRRQIGAGEFVNQAMRRWMDQVEFVRTVPIPDLLGQGEIEIAFNRIRQSGVGVLDPASGSNRFIDLRNPAAQQGFAELLRRQVPLPLLPIDRPASFLRAEGFFGTGRGDQLIPILIEANSPLAEKGLAQPGRYLFRRAALDDWLRQRRK